MVPSIIDTDNVVIRFSGDSGDGMQLTGTLFSNVSAIIGNEISTFPDFPSEIRAPQGTLGGVSGFQVHLGSSKVYTPGDQADVLVAMNPAALKVNANGVKRNGVVIMDADCFEKSDLEKAGFTTENPFEELGLTSVQVVPTPLSSLTKASLEGSGLDAKAVLRSKNMFALGLICWLFNRPIEQAQHFLSQKFAKKPTILESNIKVLTDGFHYGNNIQASVSTFQVGKSHAIAQGRYTSMAGNKATAWGLIAAAQKAGLQLFLGSYPITPATDILHELAARKDMGVKVVQAEDEIAGICTAIGAAFAGDLAATSTSGPGLALKSEAINLAIMAELPLVVIDVQRSGPSTGIPTKTEQTDLLQALYGRNGESPLVVLAASTPDNCFDFAYTAAKLALEHQTPVILLTDAFIANGSSLWKLPKLAELPAINAPRLTAAQADKTTFDRNENGVHYWAIPGTEGFQHRTGGLERDAVKGSLSSEPLNHQKMVNIRQAKIDKIADFIPELTVEGDADADTLAVSWGSTYGHLRSAVETLNAAGKKTAHAHFNYILPLPKNTAEVLSKYKKIAVCELNMGQFASYLKSKIAGNYVFYGKVQGQPFTVSELVEFLENL